MKNLLISVTFALVLVLLGAGAVSANSIEGTISYYDTADLTYGYFVVPEMLDGYTFSGKITGNNSDAVAELGNEDFSISIDENGTKLAFSSEERWTEGEYTAVIKAFGGKTETFITYTVSVFYEIKRPDVANSQLPANQEQYRLFFKEFLMADSATFNVAMMDSTPKMVATTYLDFSSENLVSSMLTKTDSGIEGYSFVEMVTLFKTEPVKQGEYQLYFNIDEDLIFYQDYGRVTVADTPIIQSVSPSLTEDFLYGENLVLPMIAGASEFDLVVTGFQIDPRFLSANLYNVAGDRVARSTGYSYHDTLVLGYGAINGYQKETGIQALVLHMAVSSTATLNEDETYRVALSYEGSSLSGKCEADFVPQSGVFVVKADPFDIGKILLEVVNFSSADSYEIYLYDDAYGELSAGSVMIPKDGILELDVGTPLTRGQGVLYSPDGQQAQFFYKNELISLFMPRLIQANPMVLHPTTKEFVARFTMNNFSISSTARIFVQLLQYGTRHEEGYIPFETPMVVAQSNQIQSIVRSKKDGYYDTDILAEIAITSALDEHGVYGYLMNIDGYEIRLDEQGEEFLVYVENNTISYAELLDRTYFDGVPVLQDELYFWCSGVVVRDPSALEFLLVDADGTVVAEMAPGSLTPLSMDAERQFCGKLIVTEPMLSGAGYRLVARYNGTVLYTSPEYFGNDTVASTIMVRDDTAFQPGSNLIHVYSQLVNIPANEVAFEVIDLSKPYEAIKVLKTRTQYNYDTYYQWKHDLILDTSLHEGVYKVVITYRGEVLADTMICFSSEERIMGYQPNFNGTTIDGYWLTLENVEPNATYGLLIGQDQAFANAVEILEKVPQDARLYLSKADLIDLGVGSYTILLTKNSVPVSSTTFYYSPFSTPLEVVGGNIKNGELDRYEKVLSVEFSQPLNINTVSKETVQLFDPDGELLPISVSTSADRRTLFVQPNLVLRDEVQYTLSLTPFLRAMYYGQPSETIKLRFFMRAGEQSKTDFFVSKEQATEITDNENYSLHFAENSFSEDELLGVWLEDVSVDLSGYFGLSQQGPVFVVTDYGVDGTFEQPAVLTFYNRQLTQGDSLLLLWYNPKTGRYERGSDCTFADGVVRTSISKCGRYIVCEAKRVPFNDVRGLWSEYYIGELWQYGIVSGYSYSVFEPELLITRSEFVKMLVLSLGLSTSDSESYNLKLFRDSAEIEEWALSYWATAYQLNIIKGTEKNLLSPNDYITRAEIVTMIGRAKSLNSTNTPVFKDASEIPDWSRNYFIAAYDVGILSGYPDGTVRPNACATRAETSKMIVDLIRFCK